MFFLCSQPIAASCGWCFITSVLCGGCVNRGTQGLEAARCTDAPAASLTIRARISDFPG